MMPTTVPIPPWNAEGLLPAADVANPTSATRSPYPVALGDVVLRFNTSPDRAAILRGFLEYRAALHVAGLTAGFQWLDGSFMEHIEAGSRNRPPNDIDVVTFYRLPPGVTQADLVTRTPDLFPSNVIQLKALKARYKVDARALHLGMVSEKLVDRSAYWYGVWVHQRSTFKWKGFLQIDLAPGEDAAARALLAPPAPAATP
jgi:hypothetical protein